MWMNYMQDVYGSHKPPTRADILVRENQAEHTQKAAAVHWLLKTLPPKWSRHKLLTRMVGWNLATSRWNPQPSTGCWCIFPCFGLRGRVLKLDLNSQLQYPLFLMMLLTSSPIHLLLQWAEMKERQHTHMKAVSNNKILIMGSKYYTRWPWT